MDPYLKGFNDGYKKAQEITSNDIDESIIEGVKKEYATVKGVLVPKGLITRYEILSLPYSLEELGVTVTDAKGFLRDPEDVLAEIRMKTITVTETIKRRGNHNA